MKQSCIHQETFLALASRDNVRSLAMEEMYRTGQGLVLFLLSYLFSAISNFQECTYFELLLIRDKILAAVLPSLVCTGVTVTPSSE